MSFTSYTYCRRDAIMRVSIGLAASDTAGVIAAAMPWAIAHTLPAQPSGRGRLAMKVSAAPRPSRPSPRARPRRSLCRCRFRHRPGRRGIARVVLRQQRRQCPRYGVRLIAGGQDRDDGRPQVVVGLRLPLQQSFSGPPELPVRRHQVHPRGGAHRSGDRKSKHASSLAHPRTSQVTLCPFWGLPTWPLGRVGRRIRAR
jgi:hypothetical protein